MSKDTFDSDGGSTPNAIAPTLIEDYAEPSGETQAEEIRPEATLEQTNDTKTLANLQRDVP
jgi:hypothetical protein